MKKIRRFLEFMKEEKGIGVVEVILILVVLIGLVIIFKSQLTDLVQSIFDKITSESGRIYGWWTGAKRRDHCVFKSCFSFDLVVSRCNGRKCINSSAQKL